jgi:DNA-binding MarR family transcriptional regulator
MDQAQRIAELVQRLGRVAHGLQYCGGLNPAQWQALRFFHRANKYSCSPGALAEFLGTTRGTASQTLIALETKGYITRSRCADDRRSVAVHLTERGEALLAEDPLGKIAEAGAALPAEARAGLIDGMGRLLRALRQEHGMAEFGLCMECVHFCDDAVKSAATASCRCALTGEAVEPRARDKICVEFGAPG